MSEQRTIAGQMKGGGELIILKFVAKLHRTVKMSAFGKNSLSLDEKLAASR